MSLGKYHVCIFTVTLTVTDGKCNISTIFFYDNSLIVDTNFIALLCTFLIAAMFFLKCGQYPKVYYHQGNVLSSTTLK